MVLLTMTPAIVAAIEKCQAVASVEEMAKLQLADNPSLLYPRLGSPIAHEKLIGISEMLRAHTSYSKDDRSGSEIESEHAVRLNSLLRGSRVYAPPAQPKPEPSEEYKQLMARLRKEDEARRYERMLNPPPPLETFSQRFPASANTNMFPTATDLAKEEEDEVTYADVNRQLAMIANVLISIIACSVAIWIAARNWSVPSRLGLSMSGSILVAVAEVVIYAGYLRRIKEAKHEEKKKVEKKEIMDTWIIDGSSGVKSTGSNIRKRAKQQHKIEN
ncbi:hypothetical protein K490DRAFT_39210 [Saccharata proteae CBS 121410]|uniref:Uncharacterized protein n=1 Tax=Saccharata proteae CBS 121410 TaxID=1314787 RepID=A0A9P4HRQ2_9PEZI|nr:hypothetical protein K490DRAFT_49947 [Saccharata proteae CBS 121410]KAF2088392.1 hypothetical protein K490DRAFT_39210 [Saccharata proteae CBS 121410]